MWALGGPITFMVGKTLTLSFSQPGNYIMYHRVYSSIGDMDSISKVFTVLARGPQSVWLCPSADTMQVHWYDAGTSYQWQVSTDSGITYSNITDNNFYSGANQQYLQIIIPSSYNHYFYRCIVDGYTNTTYFFEIICRNYFSGQVDNSWENPANWHCGKVPDANTDVVIPEGITAVLNSNASCRSISVSPGGNFSINPGFTLTVTH